MRIWVAQTSPVKGTFRETLSSTSESSTWRLVPADWQDKMMHGSLTVGEQVLISCEEA